LVELAISASSAPVLARAISAFLVSTALIWRDVPAKSAVDLKELFAAIFARSV
jgi:hypothetical protein